MRIFSFKKEIRRQNKHNRKARLSRTSFIKLKRAVISLVVFLFRNHISRAKQKPLWEKENNLQQQQESMLKILQ